MFYMEGLSKLLTFTALEGSTVAFSLNISVCKGSYSNMR